MWKRSPASVPEMKPHALKNTDNFTLEVMFIIKAS